MTAPDPSIAHASSHGSSRFLVESYAPHPEASIEAHARRFAAVARPDGPSGTVRYLGSFAIPGDELAFHLFEARDIPAVAKVCSRAGITTDRIVPVVTGSMPLPAERRRPAGILAPTPPPEVRPRSP